MRNLKHILWLVAVLTTFSVKAQDVHFSQYNASPLLLNPALTGFFNGDYRAVANFRSQWGSFTNTYRTFAASFEMSMFKGRLRDDNFGVGVFFYNDVAGTTAFGTNSLLVSAAYRKRLGSGKVKHTMTLGVQGGFIGQNLNTEELIFDNQYNGVEVDPSLLSGEQISGSTGLKPDLGVGLIYQVVPSDYFNLYLGGSYMHLIPTELILLTEGTYKLEPKITVHAGAQADVTNVLRLMPSAMYLRQGGSSEINVGSYFMFVMDYVNDAETAFALGAWMRLGNVTPDAIIFGARLDYQKFTLGLSYDLNISPLNAVSKSRGAYELSINYIGAFTTAGKRRLMIPCPEL